METTKARLESHGVKVRCLVDHEGWSKSIYFEDPNGLQLECCHLTRTFEPDDAIPQVRFRVDKGVKKPRKGGSRATAIPVMDANRQTRANTARICRWTGCWNGSSQSQPRPFDRFRTRH